VRNTQRIPLSTARASRQGRPRPSGRRWGVSKGLSTCHSASVKSMLLIYASLHNSQARAAHAHVLSFSAPKTSPIPDLLLWHQYRSAFFLDQEHYKFRRLGLASVSADDMNVAEDVLPYSDGGAGFVARHEFQFPAASV